MLEALLVTAVLWACLASHLPLPNPLSTLIMQGRALVREAMASAAAVVWVTALLPDVPQVREGFCPPVYLTPLTRRPLPAAVLPLVQGMAATLLAPRLSPYAGHGCSPPGRRAVLQP